MTLSELKEMVIYIIKRETFFSREHAERITEEILEQIDWYKKYEGGDGDNGIY